MSSWWEENKPHDLIIEGPLDEQQAALLHSPSMAVGDPEDDAVDALKYAYSAMTREQREVAIFKQHIEDILHYHFYGTTTLTVELSPYADSIVVYVEHPMYTTSRMVPSLTLAMAKSPTDVAKNVGYQIAQEIHNALKLPPILTPGVYIAQPITGYSAQVTLWKRFPGAHTIVTPPCGCPDSDSNVMTAVMHLNDRHRWSRETIADWLDLLVEQGVDLTVHEPSEPKEVSDAATAEAKAFDLYKHDGPIGAATINCITTPPTS